MLSAFGVQFAPRHEIVAQELARVCRPGGRIGLVNWTPEGQIGELFKIMGRYMPPAARLRLAAAAVGRARSTCAACSPARASSSSSPAASTRGGSTPPEHYVAFMETHYGPTLKARERLTAEGRWEECRAEILAMAERRNEATDGSLLMYAEYLVTVGRKAGVAMAGADRPARTAATCGPCDPLAASRGAAERDRAVDLVVAQRLVQQGDPRDRPPHAVRVLLGGTPAAARVPSGPSRTSNPRGSETRWR